MAPTHKMKKSGTEHVFETYNEPEKSLLPDDDGFDDREAKVGDWTFNLGG